MGIKKASKRDDINVHNFIIDYGTLIRYYFVSLIYQKRKDMTTTNTQIENLTKLQLELFKRLVRLGDSKELALKTVLDDRFNPEIKKDNSMYEFAYYS